VAGGGEAKGVVDKIPGLVHFPFVARVLGPGSAAAGLLWLVVGWRLTLPTELGTSKLAELGSLLTFLAWSIGLGSLLAVVLGDTIYKIYEGLIFWPTRIFDWGVRRHQARIDAFLKTAETMSGSNYDRIWFKLRRYPLNAEGRPYASRPTLLGNILDSYEDYPRTRYGMDAVFYWPRLWLEVDKDKKEEIDAAWSIADGLVSLSAIALSAGAFGLILAAARGLVGCLAIAWPQLANLPTRLAYPPAMSPRLVAVGAFALVGAGYALYRLSLSFHRRNGETFKALFDLYRAKLEPMSRISTAEPVRWTDTWAYLQYLKVRCPQCVPEHYFSANNARCDRCGHERPTAMLDAPPLDGRTRQTLSDSFLQWLKSLGW
jgi:hypothetical protein